MLSNMRTKPPVTAFARTPNMGGGTAYAGKTNSGKAICERNRNAPAARYTWCTCDATPVAASGPLPEENSLESQEPNETTQKCTHRKCNRRSIALHVPATNTHRRCSGEHECLTSSDFRHLLGGPPPRKKRQTQRTDISWPRGGAFRSRRLSGLVARLGWGLASPGNSRRKKKAKTPWNCNSRDFVNWSEAEKVCVHCSRGLAAATSASHAEGRQLDPGQVYLHEWCWPSVLPI